MKTRIRGRLGRGYVAKRYLLVDGIGGDYHGYGPTPEAAYRDLERYCREIRVWPKD